jgi:cathepsin L
MKLFLLFLALVAVTFAITESEYRREFQRFQQTHQKVYSAVEFRQRYEIFKKNFDFVNNHDESVGFSVAMNEFGDLTTEEFAAIYNGLDMRPRNTIDNSFWKERSVSAPDTWDWRTEGAVTGIKNQGQCGSCWSFSATGSIEGVHFLSTKNLVSLSEQNLVDCSTSYGNMGCQGGLMDSAFKYVINNNGIDTEACYPYTATGPNQCEFKSSCVGATISGYTDVPSGNENALMTAVYGQPTSVAIDASHSSFQFYSSGVYYEPECSSTQLDHGVLAIGYGTSGGSDYWLVKNSWGTSWGMSGYIMMSRNRNNNCGIATIASYPKV